MILLHFTQFSDLAFCIPEGRQAHTGARHISNTDIPCALYPELAITLRMPLTKGVSVLRTETDHSFSLAGRAGQQRVPAADAVKGDPCRGVKSCPTALYSLLRGQRSAS